MSHPTLSSAMIHCWDQVIIHSCSQTHRDRAFGIFKFLTLTVLRATQQIGGDKSRQWNKIWQPSAWFKQHQQFPATSDPLLKPSHPSTLQVVNLQVKAGASQRQRKTKTVLSNMFTFVDRWYCNCLYGRTSAKGVHAVFCRAWNAFLTAPAAHHSSLSTYWSNAD